MCDPGMVLGIAAGAAQAAGQAQAANQNIDMINQQANLEYAAQQREQIVQDNAANKEGYQAQMEADRMASAVKTDGAGMGGNTAAQRVAEQQRQGALSIENAKDRKDAALANYALGSKSSQITATNGAAQQKINPLTAFANIASSGMSSYGAFK
jgi:hypothetical protein